MRTEINIQSKQCVLAGWYFEGTGAVHVVAARVGLAVVVVDLVSRKVGNTTKDGSPDDLVPAKFFFICCCCFFFIVGNQGQTSNISNSVR